MLKFSRSVYLFAVIVFTSILYGCLSRHPVSLYELQLADRVECSQIDNRIDLTDRIGGLNLIAHAYYHRCYEKVLRYGAVAQTEYRQKHFSILKETGNVFLPDGTTTDYVLESYERAFLSFLIASSYLNLDQIGESKVELRRLDHELTTPLYNFGEDPVNILLQAVLWERLGEVGESRVDWNRLHDQERLGEVVRAFATQRMEAIDRHDPIRSGWKIYAIDSFPGIEWHLKWTNSTGGYYSIRPAWRFLEGCASDTGLLLSTESWFHKIAARYQDDYHPFLNFQSWVRLPVGLTYGVTTFMFGTGIAVGGCALDASMKGRGDLCRGAIEGGIELMKKTPEVVRKTLEPDLRHWENIPAAFLVTTADDLKGENCFHLFGEDPYQRVKRIL